MNNTSYNCVVCGEPIKKGLLVCSKCGCKYPAPEYFAGVKSFQAWRKSVHDFQILKNREKAELFRKGKLVLFPSRLCFTGFESDYTTVYDGNEKAEQLNGVVQCSVGTRHSVYLKTDGTVYAVGSNDDGQCNLDDLTNVKAIYAGANCTYVVNAQGDVIVRGFSPVEEKVGNWCNIKKITGSKGRVVGLTEDGVVKIADDIQNEEPDARGVVDVDTTYNFTIWLYADGTVGCASRTNDPRSAVFEWRDIIAVGVENYYAVGLKKDGTVVYSGNTIPGIDMERSSIAHWTDVIALNCSNSGILGVFADGTAKLVGNVENREKIQEAFQKDLTKHLFS